jgi:hypothetical protein
LDDVPFPPFANPKSGTPSTGRATQWSIYATPEEGAWPPDGTCRTRRSGAATVSMPPDVHRPHRGVPGGGNPNLKAQVACCSPVTRWTRAQCLVVNNFAVTKSVLRSRSVHELEPLSEYHTEVDQ